MAQFAPQLPVLHDSQDDVRQVLGRIHQFPGGFGTLDELFEALTLIQTGKLGTFPIVLFGMDHWSGLVRWIEETLVTEGKVARGHRDLLTVTDDPEYAVSRMVDAYREMQETDPIPPGATSWDPPGLKPNGR